MVDRNAVGDTIGHLQKSRGIMAKRYGDHVGEELGFISGERWCVDVDSEHVKEIMMAFCIRWWVVVMTALAGGPGAYDAVPDSPPDRFLEDRRFKGIEHDLPVIQLGPNLDWNKLWLTTWVVLLHVCVSLGSGLGIVDGMANRSYTGTS